MVLACAAVTAPSIASAQEDQFTVDTCATWNDRTNKAAEGPCRVRSATVNGNFAYVVSFADGSRVTVEYIERQGAYHRLKIDGRPAFGYEPNRTAMRAATLDLKQNVEWGD
jgi:hypothetical protein